MPTSEGIPSSIDIEFLELNDNPYNSDVVKHQNLSNKNKKKVIEIHLFVCYIAIV